MHLFGENSQIAKGDLKSTKFGKDMEITFRDKNLYLPSPPNSDFVVIVTVFFLPLSEGDAM